MRRILGLLIPALLGLSLVTVGGPAHAAAAPAQVLATPGAPQVGPTRMLVQRLFEDRVLVLTNRKRRAHGCPSLKSSLALRRAARAHTVTMAEHDEMSHQLPGEPVFTTRITRAGYRHWSMVAENVARGFAGPAAVVRAWMASPGHRANILNCRLRHLGVGVALSRGQLWWTQDFGRK